VGWCSATDIMDTALDAATAAVAAMWQVATDNEDVRTPAWANDMNERPELRAKLDEVLRPFVTTLAEKLRENDWDCVDESRYFERFPQEMHGHSDSEHRAWLVEMVVDTEGDQQWVDRLAAFNAKTGAQTSGR
jgi:hypothetical protein